MKITQSKNPLLRNTLLAGGLAAITLGIGAYIYVYAYNGSILGWSKNEPISDSTVNYDPPTQEQKDEGLAAKEAFINKHYSDMGKKDTNGNTPSAPNKDVSIIISSTSQTSDIAQIRTTIQTTSSGSCTLAMTISGGKTVTREAETQNLGSYSTCKGFDIPLSELQAGTWDVTIKYENATESGTTNQQVEIK